MARLFVAVWPPSEVVDALCRLPRPAGAGVRWTTPDQWHVTLRFLGETDPVEAEAALRELDPPASELRLGPGTVLLGRDVVALPAHGVDELAAAVLEVTRGVGRPPARRPFHGHLTLARLRRGAGRPARMAFEARWDVRTVELVESDLRPTGASYRTRATVAVAGPRPSPAGSSDRSAVAGEDGEPGHPHGRDGESGVDHRDHQGGGDQVEREDAL